MKYIIEQIKTLIAQNKEAIATRENRVKEYIEFGSRFGMSSFEKAIEIEQKEIEYMKSEIEKLTKALEALEA